MHGQYKGRGPGPRDYTGSNEVGNHPHTGAGSGGAYPSGAGGSRHGRLSEADRQAAYLAEDPRRAHARSLPRHYRRSDERVREEICERLADDVRLDVTDVSVDVKAGRVTLEGTVPERRMKYLVEDTAAECLGANDVENRIGVRSHRAPDRGEHSAGTGEPGNAAGISGTTGRTAFGTPPSGLRENRADATGVVDR
jgi:hypothetical protein